MFAVSYQFIRTHNRSVASAYAQRGFSLIELLIVLAIMAVIAATAFPAMNTLMERQRNKEMTGTIVNALKEARAESILRGRNIDVQIGSSKVDLTMSVVSGETQQERSETVKSYTFFDNGSTPTGAVTMTFQPNKRVSGVGIITTFCDKYATRAGRKIVVDVNGNISVDTGDSKC